MFAHTSHTTHTLTLIRHGESTWNVTNRFTGWVDVDLTLKGEMQAHQAGTLLKEAGFSFDLAYTSVLKRAIRTLWKTLDTMDLMWLPIQTDWRLNERHYGALQGLNKTETAEKYGDEQVQIWRRSYEIPPPSLSEQQTAVFYADPRYAHLNHHEIPLTECLKDTVERLLPCWQDSIAPAIQKGKRILISAHGNSLRALIKILDRLSHDEIMQVNIPNGQPLVYTLDQHLRPIDRRYLGDPAVIERASREET